ncbi:19183_t:CDS:1, partial [Racocetra persica]
FIDTFNNKTSSSYLIVVENTALEVVYLLPNLSDNNQLHEDKTLNDNENFNNKILDEDKDMIQ